MFSNHKDSYGPLYLLGSEVVHVRLDGVILAWLNVQLISNDCSSPMRDISVDIVPYMGQFRKHLADEMRRRRGGLSMRYFAVKVGLSKTSLLRIENEEQNVTIDTLEHLSKKFKCDAGDLIGTRN